MINIGCIKVLKMHYREKADRFWVLPLRLTLDIRFESVNLSVEVSVKFLSDSNFQGDLTNRRNPKLAL